MEYKGYDVKLVKNVTQYQIVGIGKGALPKSMSGLFTTPKEAHKAIDAYVSSKVKE